MDRNNNRVFMFLSQKITIIGAAKCTKTDKQGKKHKKNSITYKYKIS